MGLIADNDRETIRAHFDESLSGDVEIVMFTERESPIIIPGKQLARCVLRPRSFLKR